MLVTNKVRETIRILKKTDEEDPKAAAGFVKDAAKKAISNVKRAAKERDFDAIANVVSVGKEKQPLRRSSRRPRKPSLILSRKKVPKLRNAATSQRDLELLIKEFEFRRRKVAHTGAQLG